MINDPEQMFWQLMEPVLALSYRVLCAALKLTLIFIIPIACIVIGFDWASPTSHVSLPSTLIACASMAIGLTATLPDPPDLNGACQGAVV